MKFWHDGQIPTDPQTYFRSRRLRNTLILLVLAAVTYFAGQLIGFNLPMVFEKAPKALVRFTELYIPPRFLEVDKLAEAVWVTAVLAITAGTLGSILAYFTALGMSKTTGRNVVVKYVLRGFASFIRNVPASIWAILLLMAFWFGEFLALFVMTLGTYGFNARLFSDMIDETNPHSIEALEATGANYWQIITQAVIPETLPPFISWSLYAVELNIRSATIIGMLAGGGIGHLIGIYKHFRRFDELSAAVIIVVVMILLFDQLSMYIRKKVLV